MVMARNASSGAYQLLYDLEKKLKDLEYRTLKTENHFSPTIDDRMGGFLEISTTMRKSLFAVEKLGKCNIDDVSIITGRHRSVENRYLNELVRIGWLGKERNGKKIYFHIKRALSNPTVSDLKNYQLKVDEFGVEKVA